MPLEGLWAQVDALWGEGESFYLTAEEAERHREESEGFRVTSGVEDAVNEYLDNMPEDAPVEVMTTGQIVAHLGLGELHCLSPVQKRELTAVLTKRLGKRRKIGGVQRAYSVPVTAIP